jgi:signal transduction histidine kinase
VTTLEALSAGGDAVRGRLWRRHEVLKMRWLWIALWPLGLAAELAVLWPVVFGDQAGAANVSDFVYRVTGGSFIVSGLIAWQRRPENRVGALMVAVGFALFADPLLSQPDSSLAKTLGLLFTDFWSVIFAVLLLCFPHGRRIKGKVDRLLVLAFAVPAVIMQLAWLLFLEERGHLLLSRGFSNAFLVWPNAQIADAIESGQRSLFLPATISLFLVLAWRWLKASPPLRRVLVPVLAGGASMLSFAVLLTTDLISGSRVQLVLLVTYLVLATVPIAFLAGFLRSRLARSAVGDLLLELPENPSPSELRDALSRSLRDPSLTLAYWLPEFESWADLDGRPVELPGRSGGRATTLIDRDGARLAALVHDPALEEEPELLASVGAAAGIALENGRLHAEQRAHLEELRGSRARVIEAGQKERQRLERDLHDGAQQRLIALSLELGRLERHLAGDANVQARLDEARCEIALSLEELRAVSRGLHPAVLSGHGLEVALESIAAHAPVPVRLTVGLESRLPELIEVAAYYVVSEGLANIGKHAQATSVSIDVAREDGGVVIEVVDDGVGGADTELGSGLRGLADRVEAHGGRLRVWSPSGGGTRLRAEMPCG